MARVVKRVFVFCSGCLLLVSGLHAADIFRWVDERGQTHISDVVPEKYKKSATRIESRQYELPDDQRREAEARAAQDKLKAAEAAQQRARDLAAGAAGSATAASGASAPSRKPEGEGKDCATLRRLYKESLECFAPYRTAKGATKAEAFEKCTVVADPVPQCGYP